MNETGPAQSSSPEDCSLSAAGVARRAAILQELKRSMRRRHLGRAAARLAIVGGGVAGAAAVAWLAHVPRSGVGPLHAPPAGASMIAQVETDPGILERLAAPTFETSARTLTDAQLGTLLAEQGMAVGIIRTGGRAILAQELETAEESSDGDASS